MSAYTTIDFWQGNHAAIATNLKQTIERLIRVIVLSEYLDVDNTLGRAIEGHLFSKIPKTRRRAQQTTVEKMLDRLYLLGKLALVESFREVPKDIGKKIRALNDVRNVLAHSFLLDRNVKARIRYRGRHNLFAKAGLQRFRDDMWTISEFFDPKIVQRSLELVRSQKQRNKAIAGADQGG